MGTATNQALVQPALNHSVRSESCSSCVQFPTTLLAWYNHESAFRHRLDDTFDYVAVLLSFYYSRPRCSPPPSCDPFVFYTSFTTLFLIPQSIHPYPTDVSTVSIEHFTTRRRSGRTVPERSLPAHPWEELRQSSRADANDALHTV